MVIYKSECGQYLCRSVSTSTGGNYEAWSIDGCIHWRHDNRIRTWADEKKFNRPMAYCVGGYSCEKTGQKKGSFTLSLLHCDTTKVLKPFSGNTIIESIEVVFRRKVPVQNVPKWLSEG